MEQNSSTSSIKPLFGTVAQTVISRYNYGRERSQSRKYNITVFYQCINQKGPWVLQAICLVHLYWMVADIRRQHPIVLSKKIIIRMYRKKCKINQEISGNPKIKQGIYSGWILYVRELPMAVGNLGLQRQILSATHQLLFCSTGVADGCRTSTKYDICTGMSQKKKSTIRISFICTVESIVKFSGSTRLGSRTFVPQSPL